MRLLYDLTATQPSPESRFHGGGAYGEVVFFKLLDYIDSFTFICYYDSSLYINPEIIQQIKNKNLKLYDIKKTTVSKIIEIERIERLYSAMLNLNQNIPLNSIDVYTTVHGLRTLEMPFDSIMLTYASTIIQKIKFKLFMGIAKYFYIKKLTQINSRLVTNPRINVITISNHSLASIKNFFPETINKFIPVFASPTFDQLDNNSNFITKSESSSDIFTRYNISQKQYFLLTSAARWTKNTMRAIIAFDELFSSGITNKYKVVITGVTNKKIFTKRIKNINNFILLEYINRNDLDLLTKNAYAFIYPSLNEGFGYPPIESMKYGVPVAASGTSSIPEVCGDAALYFDPYSISEIKNRIIQLLDNSIYNQFVQKSYNHYPIIAQKQKVDLTNLVNYILHE